MTQTAASASSPVLIEAKSLRRRELAWATLRPAVLARARDSATLEEVHDLIRDVLNKLGDNHSFLWTAASKRRLSAADHAGLRFHQDEPVIIHVSAVGPAAARGLRQGDRIVAVNGQRVG